MRFSPPAFFFFSHFFCRGLIGPKKQWFCPAIPNHHFQAWQFITSKLQATNGSSAARQPKVIR
jgi:hypothetical protein